MTKGPRLALKDEYYCYGCKAFHKFAEQERVLHNKRSYCKLKWDKVKHMIKGTKYGS